MKKRSFLILIILVFIVEALVCVLFMAKVENIKQDNVKINDCLKTVEENYGNTSLYPDSLRYSIIGIDGTVLYKTNGDVSLSINEAVQRNDTILDLMIDGELVGHMIFFNDTMERVSGWRTSIIITVIACSAVQAGILIAYFIYMRKTVTEPFNKLNDFAQRVAAGNLDVPLDMDKGQAFGSFTEAFDIMRTELKKSREAEKEASDSKKEMVSKLSHDIRTPVASIKSASEFGYELASDDKVKEKFNMINIKADELTVLVDNLFNSSISDSTEISVSPMENDSSTVKDAIIHADYLNRAGKFEIPECKVFTDKLRLQQAFDNVFINSYKYADTEITVDAKLEDGYLKVSVCDKGPGVTEEEVAVLKEKYKRGENSKGKDGAGLGLYLTSYFLKSMDGDIFITNEDPGLKVLFLIRTI